MSNEIMIPEVGQLPAYLRDDSVGDEFIGGVTGRFPLAFLSLRGKEFRLRKGGQEVNTRRRELSVIMVAARPTLSKRYFRARYQSGTTAAPDCSSLDAITPNVPDPVAPKCGTCPKNAFGSGVDQDGNPTKGKACQDYKRLIVWPVGLTDDLFVLDVSATSLKAPKGQAHNVLMYNDYVTVLAKHGLNPLKVITKLAFTDAEYPQLCFQFERLVTEEEHARIMELRDSEDVQQVVGEDIHETAGTVEEVVAPEPEAKPEEPEVEAEPEPAPKPAPKAKAKASKPEPKPEAKDTEVDDDLLAEIEKLLGGK